MVGFDPDIAGPRNVLCACTGAHAFRDRLVVLMYRMAALLRRVLEKERSGAPLPLPAVASGVRGSRFATAFGRMLQARSARGSRAPGKFPPCGMSQHADTQAAQSTE